MCSLKMATKNGRNMWELLLYLDQFNKMKTDLFLQCVYTCVTMRVHVCYNNH